MKVYNLVQESCLGSLDIVKDEICKLLDQQNCNFTVSTETNIEVKENIVTIQSSVAIKRR